MRKLSVIIISPPALTVLNKNQLPKGLCEKCGLKNFGTTCFLGLFRSSCSAQLLHIIIVYLYIVDQYNYK